MKDIGSVLIPIAVMLIMAAAITVIVVGYLRYERRRAEALAGELERHREVMERALRQQEQTHARVEELTARVTAVEQLLRSVE